MSRYGYSIYGSTKYGLPPLLQYSVEPMSITVLGFNEVFLSWVSPQGNFTRFRIVRNQDAFPETAEDGVIIYEVNSLTGDSLSDESFRTFISDGVDNPESLPITSGKPVYYRVFLFTQDNVWVKGGEIRDIVPNNSGATTKIMNLLPRVTTTKEQSPLGVVDESSDLYKFIDALAFSYEQMLTEIELARPKHGFDSSTYSTIPAEVDHRGLSLEPNLPVLRQRALIREAIPLYAEKGTALGVANYAEAFTGFAPTITVSKNLLLSPQDSTFYKTTGSWMSAVDTIESVNDYAPSTLDVAEVIDTEYTCKVTATANNYMSLGETSPITQGIPVSPSTDYTLYCEFSAPSSASLEAKVTYYDKGGNELDSTSNDTNVSSSDWVSMTVETTSPEDAYYASIRLTWWDNGTYYIDRVMFSLSSATTYQEARAATIELAPTRENYIYNPSFEVDDSAWTLDGATFSQDSSVPVLGTPGSYSGKFVGASDWTLQHDPELPLENGIYFTVSQYVKSDDITSFDAVIELYDSSDTLLDSSTESLVVTDSWERIYTTVLVPSGSTATYAKYRIEAPAGTLYMDMVMAQDAYTPTDYFDGTLTEFGAIWRGTANNSASMLYPSKRVKFLRLAETLNDWVPMNLWWRLTTPAGLEYTVLDV